MTFAARAVRYGEEKVLTRSPSAGSLLRWIDVYRVPTPMKPLVTGEALGPYPYRLYAAKGILPYRNERLLCHGYSCH